MQTRGLFFKPWFTGLKTGGLPGFSGTRVAFPTLKAKAKAKAWIFEAKAVQI